MPRVARELSPLDIKRLQNPGRGKNVSVAVGGVSGLLIQITPAGGKSWILRTHIGGKRREIGLGGFPDVSLSQARDRARSAKEQVWNGVDPIEERKSKRSALVSAQKRGLKFKDAVEKYLETKLGEFKNEKHKKQWRSTLDTYAAPVLGDMLVSEIQITDVQRVLTPIWNEKTETAVRLRGRIELVLAWATVAGNRTGDNPARWRGNLDAVLPKPGKVANVENQPAIGLADAAKWFAALKDRKGTSARALEFLAMTASRSGEVRGAKWSEFDFEAGIWTVPAERMKMKREHRVPLTPEAVSLIQGMPKFKDVEFVFAAVRGGTLSDMSISAVMRRMHQDAIDAGLPGWIDARSKRPAVPHGLRSTFRDWAAERTEYPRDMAEMALAHNVGSEVERAYRRTDMVERRRAMMAEWNRFLAGGA
ncbi:site-specific integrase [Asticcacaulis sp. YBE204]|uniref:tyrosine-type recombinase/integrase n=1 Tax=Asticcacaulis sp. YBE204 TaxID=1282363 RepID=UPI0003C3D586|nr:site-specific integrase [Asticcacaulis sp. YBE204]ESQ76907.1 hypothetical protein AEYBE204_18700 [Asticcacaulis sp. YBE204]